MPGAECGQGDGCDRDITEGWVDVFAEYLPVVVAGGGLQVAGRQPCFGVLAPAAIVDWKLELVNRLLLGARVSSDW